MGHRVAFLIGNQTYHDNGLRPLCGPLNDIDALSEVLGDPERGGFEIRPFRDASSGEIKAAIEEELNQAGRGDLVLIAYAGHGKLDRTGKLFLATADTRTTALLATSIPTQQIREMVANSDCDAVVLLLDCCYSGVATGLRGDIESELRSLQKASGFYILSATSQIETAGEAETSTNGGAVMGRFTFALVEGIRTGAADHDRDGEITLGDLVRYVRRSVKHQTPQSFSEYASGDPLISWSPTTDERLPADVLDGLTADSPLVRIGAAWRLARLARANDSSRSHHAERKIIERLDSENCEQDESVREALQEALQIAVARDLPDFKGLENPLPDLAGSVNPLNITGVWECNDGGIYYIRNIGREVWWFGHGCHPHQSFANAAYGRVEGEGDNLLLRLKWVDVPAGTTNVYGRLTLRFSFSSELNRVTHMSTAESSGDFGGSLWTWSAKWGDRLRNI